jgi:hypothetical protein
VLREALAGQPFLHIDLVLQPGFATVASALAGRSFASGSPCFLGISDRAWLEAWREAIATFDRDPDGTTRRLGCQGTPFRRHIGGDRDLLNALLKAGRLAQGRRHPAHPPRAPPRLDMTAPARNPPGQRLPPCRQVAP